MNTQGTHKFIFLLIIMMFVTGCSVRRNTIHLPTSAKYNASGEITIPFPYTDKSQNGIEQLYINKDTSNKLILNVIYKNKMIGVFPVNAVGINKVNENMTFNGIEYTLTSITLNNDLVSSSITLQNK